MTDQPFTVEVHRRPAHRFQQPAGAPGADQPRHRADAARTRFLRQQQPRRRQHISSLYAVDPNGQTKYPVLRDAHGRRCVPGSSGTQTGRTAQCLRAASLAAGHVQFGRNRFPKADPILDVPIGLPQAGEPIPPEAAIGNPGSVPRPACPCPSRRRRPSTSRPPTTSPTFTPTRRNSSPPAAPMKGIGTIDSGNSTVPFTVEVLASRRSAAGATCASRSPTTAAATSTPPASSRRHRRTRRPAGRSAACTSWTRPASSVSRSCDQPDAGALLEDRSRARARGTPHAGSAVSRDPGHGEKRVRLFPAHRADFQRAREPLTFTNTSSRELCSACSTESGRSSGRRLMRRITHAQTAGGRSGRSVASGSASPRDGWR